MKNTLKKPKVEIGSTYRETRDMLTELIAKHEVNVRETLAINHACYFCREAINEWKRIEVEVADERISLHTACYHQATTCYN